MDEVVVSRRRVLAAPLVLLPHGALRAVEAAAGLSSNQLQVLDATLRASYPEVRALLVQRAGRTGFHYYRADTGAAQRLNVASVTKSVVSLLVGIAVGDRTLRVDEPLSAFFPEATRPELDRVTVRHLLTMSSGLDAGPTPDDYIDFSMRLYSPGWPAHALARRLAAPPGTKFVYSNTDAHLLAVVLARRLDRPLLAFARERLFAPLGIEAVEWSAGSDGVPNGASELKLAAPELVRLGQLMLQGGRWQDRQLVPRDYVEQATKRQVPTHFPARGRPELWGYGYLWWTASTPRDEHPTFAAAGYGGQFIYVVPALDLVVAALTQQQSRTVAARVAELLRTQVLATVAR
jgi:CubicO group peptidase (beta-lactamase class C family)